MEEKSIDNLQKELMETESFDQFYQENAEYLMDLQGAEILKKLFNRRKMSKSLLAARSGMSEVYLHQLFSGRRNPSRKRVLCLCVGMDATIEESQELLQAFGFARLYVKDNWDAVVLYGLSHHLELDQVKDLLAEYQQEKLTTE